LERTRVRAIGVDVGGTFTDAVLLLEDESTAIGKSSTTRDDPTAGALTAIGRAADGIGKSIDSVLRSAEWLSQGTTVGLNAVVTGSGAKVGLLTTQGFEATLPIAKANSIHGLDELLQTEAIAWSKPDLLVPRALIKGVPERIDVRGSVVRPLDHQVARRLVNELGDAGVEAIAVSLLWSIFNSAHENMLLEIVEQELPGTSVSLGSALTNRMGEYERTVTAVINAYINPLVVRYLDRLELQLRDHGFAGRLLTTSTDGGVEGVERARRFPIHTLNSGPIGGLAASRDLARRSGRLNVISTDVGGTSFDVGLIVGGEMQYTRSARVNRHALSIPVVEVSSIGTGGGSIAWIDPATGSLRVGPRSAGAEPGPICYGKGGDLPTVTDAACVLGYLGQIGDMTILDRARAEEELKSQIADPLGLELHDAAEGILQIANAQMADLIRKMTVLRGRDPSEFCLYAFGGAAPQYAGQYAAELGVHEVFIPRVASVFSAYGAATSDLLVRTEEETGHLVPTSDYEVINMRLKRLEASALEVLGGDIDTVGVAIDRAAGMRFRRQVHEYSVAIDDEALTPQSAAALEARFRQEYEQVVGRGSAYTGAEVELVNLSVEVRLPLSTSGGPAPLSVVALNGKDAELFRTRQAWFDGKLASWNVFNGETLEDGAVLEGPAFVELATTTVVVYPGQSLSIEADGNMRLLVP
jgi:N-methylhydantoinase A